MQQQNKGQQLESEAEEYLMGATAAKQGFRRRRSQSRTGVLPYNRKPVNPHPPDSSAQNYAIDSPHANPYEDEPPSYEERMSERLQDYMYTLVQIQSDLSHLRSHPVFTSSILKLKRPRKPRTAVVRSSVVSASPVRNPVEKKTNNRTSAKKGKKQIDPHQHFKTRAGTKTNVTQTEEETLPAVGRSFAEKRLVVNKNWRGRLKPGSISSLNRMHKLSVILGDRKVL